MTQPRNSQPRRSTSARQLRARRLRLAAVAGLAGPGLVLLGGCEFDSFLDPSIVGRWEATPVSVPILDRLAAIEGAPNQGIETSKIRVDDLIANPEAYRLGPGDRMEIEVRELFDTNVPERFEREVDPRGFIDLPNMASLFVQQQTVEQVQQLIVKTIQQAGILRNPTVSVVVRDRRRLTYTVIGEVGNPGIYVVTRPDLRLLEAITQAGRFSPQSVQKIYVIRQIPLSEEVNRGRGTPGTPTGPTSPTSPMSNGGSPVSPTPGGGTRPPTAERVADVIDDLTKPVPPKPQTPVPSPAFIGSQGSSGSGQPIDTRAATAPAPAPAAAPRRPAIDLGSETVPGTPAAPRGTDAAQPAAAPATQPATAPAAPLPAAASAIASGARAGDVTWVFIDGQWVQVTKPTGGVIVQPPPLPANQPADRPSSALPAGPGSPATPAGGRAPAIDLPSGPGAPPGPTAPGPNGEPVPLEMSQLLTQRVIEIPVAELVAGDATKNIVIRPGDIIRVLPPAQGVFYVDGAVARPGVFTLSPDTRMTLQRAITSSGGLSSIAIPERVELTRMIGPDRQATIRLNLRAIAEGHHPDIFIRPDDRVNVGTNFWATPLAVLRNGFRASYGFGFILDRNFGFDAFGPQNTGNGGN